MDDGAPFLSLYVLSVIVLQAGVTCTIILLTTQLESGKEKEPTVGIVLWCTCDPHYTV